MTTPRSLLPLAALLSLATLPLAGQDSSAGDMVIGSVGTLEVRAREVRQQLEALGEAEREALRRDPNAFGQYVRAILVQRLVLREALAASWDKSAPVAERMRLLRDGVVADTWLESRGAPPDGYPSEEELSAHYQANRESFLEPKSWLLAQIFVAAPRPPGGASEPAEPKARLEGIVAALKRDPDSFAALAAAESEESVSAAAGGEIGWLPEPRIHPDIRAILPDTKLGEISAPVRMDDGWHIIRVVDIREAHIPTLEQIREPLAEQLRAERARTGTESYLGELLREHPVAVNEVALSKLLGP